MEKKSSDNFSVNFCRAAPQPTARAKKLKLCVSVAARAMYCSATPAMQLVAVARAPCCQKGLGASRLDSSPLLVAHKEKKNFVRLSLMLLLLLYTKVAFSNGLPKVPPPLPPPPLVPLPTPQGHHQSAKWCGLARAWH